MSSLLNPRGTTKPPTRRVKSQAAIDNAEMTNWQAKIDHASDHDLRFGRPRLRREFGMRPRRDAKPVDHVRNPVRAKSRKMPLYRVADCEVIQPKASQKRTRAQKLNTIVQACHGKLRRQPERVVGRLIEAHRARRLVVLDTKTIGAKAPEIVEIAAVTSQGDALFSSRVRPRHEITDGAGAIHGMGKADVANEAAWPEVAAKLERALPSEAVCAAYNAEVNEAALNETCAIYDSEALDYRLYCVMTMVIHDLDESQILRPWVSLADACGAYGVALNGPPAAVTEARAAACLLRHFCERYQRLQSRKIKAERIKARARQRSKRRRRAA